MPGLPTGYSILAAIDGRTGKIAWKQEFRGGRPGGPLTTAGGLLFQMMADGNFQASDAKTGTSLWQFQAGSAGGGGPAAAYEIDGEQYVAIGLRNNVWAFKLGGTVPPLAAPPRVEPALQTTFAGPIKDTNEIETTSLVVDGAGTGNHFMVDEYAFSVYRARVKVGTPVRWMNNGRMIHTIAGEDGTWTTGPLTPIQAAAVTFSKAGTYAYRCKEHPWAKAQVIVIE